jgi:hypothetical protein
MNIQIFNVRDGFANNSSSSHSILFRADGEKAQDNYDDSGFHWDFFTVNSEQGILDYLRATLNSNLRCTVHRDYIECILDSWVGESSIDDDATVDHQSVITLPVRFDGKTVNKQFFMELKELMLSNNTLIMGGNDNTDDIHPLSSTDGISPDIKAEGRTYVARKDETYDYWTFFDRDYGTKFRFVLNENGQDAVFPTKSSTPDLVDIKLSDYCEFGCKFCYQGSSKDGKHASLDDLRYLLYQLESAEVFEIAYGGGEPTQYPHLVELLKATKEHNITPNFTTKNIKWLHDNIMEVVDIIGSCAVSVMCSSDLKRIQTIREFYDIRRHKICAQVVMGTVSQDTFKEIVKTACECNIPLTLLGYKNIGRGPSFQQYDYSNWMDVVKSVISSNDWYKIGVDTALVQQSTQQMLDAPNWLYHKDEGQFSWYIDAVSKTHGPSSYDVTEPYPRPSEIIETYEKYQCA